MVAAAQLLVGTYDFTGFTASGATVEDKVRTITQADVVRSGTDEILFIFLAMVFYISRSEIWSVPW
jgi:tRNA pseudouridine38-40 synthase